MKIQLTDMNRLQWLSMALLMLLPAASLKAQSGIDRYFDEYREDDRFTTVMVSSRMFGLFAEFDMDDPNEQEFVEILSKLEGLKILIGEDVALASDLFQNAKRQSDSGMEELMSMREGTQEFVFYLKEENGKTTELLMIGYESTKFMMMSLVGDINLRDIARLSQKMDIDGFEHFQNIGQ